MEALGVLAGGVAHDFNNLLMTVLGNAELAMTMLADGAHAKSMLQEIVTASISPSDLCNEMLAYAGRGTLSTETLECNALVSELGGLLQVALSKKATLVYDLHKTPLAVLADRSQLRQVIMNLITNASEALGNSDGRIVIATSVCTYTRKELEVLHPSATLEPGEYVLLRVSDTGPGMSPGLQAKIFDPFFTTKSTGRGLGLAAVKGIVLGHKGTIALESKPGTGTTFTVRLPRVPLSNEPAQVSRETGDGLPAARILVVDDEPAVGKTLSIILERAGYSVIRASDGQEAIDVYRLEGNSIDCVLLDLNMPKLGGDEVFRELRKIRKDACVILSSGFTEQEMIDRFQGAGLAGIVSTN